MNTEDALSAANRIYSKRIVLNSKKSYIGKLNNVKIFLNTHPDGLETYVDVNGNIRCPLPEEKVKQLFGWLSVNTDLPKNNRKVVLLNGEANNDEGDEADEVEEDDQFAEKKVTISHACMQGYKSALVWCYGESGIRMENNLNNWLDEFVKGYKKTIADKKEKGVMRMTEGKAPLSFQGYHTIADSFMKLEPEKKNLLGRKVYFPGSIWC
jgi:hypothetical protein